MRIYLSIKDDKLNEIKIDTDSEFTYGVYHLGDSIMINTRHSKPKDTILLALGTIFWRKRRYNEYHAYKNIKGLTTQFYDQLISLGASRQEIGGAINEVNRNDHNKTHRIEKRSYRVGEVD